MRVVLNVNRPVLIGQNHHGLDGCMLCVDWWINPVLQVAYKRSLTGNDLDGLRHNDKDSILLNKLRFYTWTANTLTWKVIIKVF